MLPITNNINAALRDEGIHLATTNVRFEKILVGTDYSEGAANALAEAITIAETFGSELFLVHAVSPVVYSDETYAVSPELLNVTLDSAKDTMAKCVAGEPRLRHLTWKTTVAYAGAAELIEQVADKEGVDLIVVASHGTSGIERLLLGSVAETILRKTTRPVLIVGPQCCIEQNPFRSIVLATDLKTTGLRAAQYASALAQQFHARLTLLHVVEKRQSAEGRDSKVFEESIKKELQNLLPAKADELCMIERRVAYGVLAEAILIAIEKNTASLLVVGLRARPVMSDHAAWSTLSNIIRQAKCGVLAIRGHLG